MRSHRAVRHVIPSRRAQVTADRVPSEKNILEASESPSFSSERQKVPRQHRVFAFRVACVRCRAPCVPAVSPHPPTDRPPRCCGAALSASGMSDCGDGAEWSGEERSAEAAHLGERRSPAWSQRPRVPTQTHEPITRHAHCAPKRDICVVISTF